jgi:hypothetical protein
MLYPCIKENKKMKKLWLLAIGVFSFAVMSPTPSRANGAVVIRDDSTCFVYNGDGAVVKTTCKKHRVISPNGTVNDTAKADVAPASAGGAAKFDFENTGDVCTTPAGLTTDWQEIVSASGEMSLTCKVH